MPLPRSPYLNERFAAAVAHFAADLKASAGISHSVIKGGEREQSLIKFLSDRLPHRFSVTTGEVVDLNGETGPQLDVLIYDRYADFPFNSGSQSVLAAEALLASIEIKSKFTSTELKNCADAARKLRQLKPHDRELGGRNIGSLDDGTKRARYMHCIFAYETDLVAAQWPQNEVRRFDQEVGSEHLVDAIYILGRGFINFNQRKARPEDDQGGAITSFYFSLLNFVMREAARRQTTPYHRYVTHGAKSWQDI